MSSYRLTTAWYPCLRDRSERQTTWRPDREMSLSTFDMRNQWLRRRVLLRQPSQPPNITAGQLALLHSVQQLPEDSEAIGESGSLLCVSYHFRPQFEPISIFCVACGNEQRIAGYGDSLTSSVIQSSMSFYYRCCSMFAGGKTNTISHYWNLNWYNSFSQIPFR